MRARSIFSVILLASSIVGEDVIGDLNVAGIMETACLLEV